MSDNTLKRTALNAVRIVSDTHPTTLLTASADNGVAAAIQIEMDVLDAKTGVPTRTAASFFWDDAQQFAEALLVIVNDAREASAARAAGASEEARDE